MSFKYVHGRRQDDFQGGAHDNSRGVHKDFTKRVHMRNVFCELAFSSCMSASTQRHVLCTEVKIAYREVFFANFRDSTKRY